jgi:hypothetical protein
VRRTLDSLHDLAKGATFVVAREPDTVGPHSVGRRGAWAGSANGLLLARLPAATPPDTTPHAALNPTQPPPPTPKARPMLELIWAPLLGAFSTLFDEYSDPRWGAAWGEGAPGVPRFTGQALACFEDRWPPSPAP